MAYRSGCPVGLRVLDPRSANNCSCGTSTVAASAVPGQKTPCALTAAQPLFDAQSTLLWPSATGNTGIQTVSLVVLGPPNALPNLVLSAKSVQSGGDGLLARGGDFRCRAFRFHSSACLYEWDIGFRWGRVRMGGSPTLNAVVSPLLDSYNATLDTLCCIIYTAPDAQFSHLLPRSPLLDVCCDLPTTWLMLAHRRGCSARLAALTKMHVDQLPDLAQESTHTMAAPLDCRYVNALPIRPEAAPMP